MSAVPCDPSREHFIPRGRRVVSIVQLPNKVNKGKSCAAAGEKRAPYYNSCVILKKRKSDSARLIHHENRKTMMPLKIN